MQPWGIQRVQRSTEREGKNGQCRASNREREEIGDEFREVSIGDLRVHQ
jgi:hypothetical protein